MKGINYIFGWCVVSMLLGFGCTTKPQEVDTISLLRSKQATDHIWVVAHRADCLYAPENSTEAVRHALYFGADMIETDVRMTKDGHIVIMHDYTVDRMTDGTGTISEMTLDEIKSTTTYFSLVGNSNYLNGSSKLNWVYVHLPKLWFMSV